MLPTTRLLLLAGAATSRCATAFEGAAAFDGTISAHSCWAPPTDTLGTVAAAATRQSRRALVSGRAAAAGRAAACD